MRIRDRSSFPKLVITLINRAVSSFFVFLFLFTLAFDREGKFLAEFEDILRNDFSGEIAEYLFNQLYRTIYYEDFIGFAVAPVGERV